MAYNRGGGMLDSEKAAVLDMRVTNLERIVERVSCAVESIDESLKTLTRLDVKHDNTDASVNRAFTNLKDHESRIRIIESEMPTLKLAKGWVIAGVVGLISLLGIELVSLVLRNHI